MSDCRLSQPKPQGCNSEEREKSDHVGHGRHEDAGRDRRIGPEAGETRGSSSKPFDNVNDYHGFQMGSGATDPNIRTASNAVMV